MTSFINPYNFVRTGNRTNRREASEYRKEKNTYTGKIHCTLKAITDLIVPNSSSSMAFDKSYNYKDHKSYEFFSYDDLNEGRTPFSEGPSAPVIPGSQLRGMIRSDYETITDSCISAVNAETVVNRRVNEAKKPCIIKKENGRISIYNANRYMLQIDNYGYVNENFGNSKTKIFKVYDFDNSKDTSGHYVAFFGVNGALDRIRRSNDVSDEQRIEADRLINQKMIIISMMSAARGQQLNEDNINKIRKLADYGIQWSELNLKQDDVVNIMSSGGRGRDKFSITTKVQEKYGQNLLAFYKKYEKSSLNINDCMICEGDEVYFNNNSITPFRTSQRNRPVSGVNVIRDNVNGKSTTVNLTKTGNNTNMKCSGYVHLGENFGAGLNIGSRKHHESVFVEGRIIEDITDDWNNNYASNLKTLLGFYEDEDINSQLNRDYMHHKGYSTFEKALEDFQNKENAVLCLYYSEVETADRKKKKYYFTPSQISKEYFDNQIKETIGSKKPCCSDGSSKVCEACALFGIVGENNKYSSKVSFSDASFIRDKAKYADVVTLPILGGPKPSAAEFYLKTPRYGNLKYWNYDYYVVQGTGNNQGSYTKKTYQPEIRGRKYYWHHRPDNYNLPDENMQLRTTVRPFKASNDDKDDFEFDVIFNGITEEELKKLVWVLSINGNNSDNCHKLGHGKPLGYGSVKIKVDGIKYKKLSIEGGTLMVDYSEENILNIPDSNEEWQSDAIVSSLLSTSSVKDYLKITDFNGLSDAEKDLVSYPFVSDRNKSYEWFGKNKRLSGPVDVIERSLPEINDRNKELPCNDADNNDNNNRKNGNNGGGRR
ncbi:MAG: TIGR03986 family CRISPR-associated RAMP protein [Lachnospiraceae bacterium]|nr:TIGR03986 family CRISPR-associated RAMP protein [Lachnospiraceae bacterium]